MANENLSGAPEDDRELSQSSNDSETWDAIINGSLTPKPATSFSDSSKSKESTPILSDEDLESDSEDYYKDRPIEAEPFFFDPEEDISENFMKDPTDFTDVAGDAVKNRIFKVVGTALLIVAVIVGGGYFGLKAFTGSQDSHQKAADEANIQIQDPGASNIAPAKPKRPLQELSAGAPTVSASKVTASVVGSTIVTTDNVSLSVKGVPLTGVQVACDTTLETDFCLVARGATPADATKMLDIYFFKDAAHSRIFENPSNFNKIEVSGSLAAASMEINLIGGKPTQVIVVVAANSSGFMIALPQDTTSDAAATFAESLALS